MRSVQAYLQLLDGGLTLFLAGVITAVRQLQRQTPGNSCHRAPRAAVGVEPVSRGQWGTWCGRLTRPPQDGSQCHVTSTGASDRHGPETFSPKCALAPPGLMAAHPDVISQIP